MSAIALFAAFLAQSAPAHAADVVRVVTDYTARGQIERTSLPQKPGDSQRWRTYQYDSLDRQVRLTQSDGGMVVTRYETQNGLSSVETLDEAGHRRVSSFDAFGNEIHQDRFDGFVRIRTTYSYDALNRLIEIRDGRGSLIWYAYDGHGNKIFAVDPDLGCREFSYDVAGRLTHQASADGASLTFSYDALGRVLDKTVDKEALQYSNCRFEIVLGSRTETGGTGDDVLNAGTSRLSDVVLTGGAGNNTYLISARSGHVTIPSAAETARGGTDTIRFVDLVLSDMTVTKEADPQHGDFLKFSWNRFGSAGLLRVADLGQHIDRFEFADGTMLSRIHLDSYNRVVLTGTDDGDYIKAGALSLGDGTGRYIDDTRIRAGDGNDTLESGVSGYEGWQTLYGQAGDDTYVIGSDAGSVFLYHDAEVAGGGTDTIRFKDLSLSYLTISILDYGASNNNGISLVLSWDAEGNRAAGRLHIANGGDQFERFEFADGTVIDEIRLDSSGRVLVNGTSGDDYIRVGARGPGDGTGRFSDDNRVYGGAGNDTLETSTSDYADWQQLYGQAGDDTYVIGSDGGSMIIDHTGELADGGMDTVRFKDLTLSDLTISYRTYYNANGVALRLEWQDEGSRPAGQLQIANSGDQIERFEFSDGDVRSLAEVRP